MRTNSNKKIHKMKRDPYALLIRLTVIVGIVVVVSAVVFYLCNSLVRSDYFSKRAAVDAENAQAEQEFNARMNALRNSSATTQVDPDTGEITTVERPFWERTIGENLWRVEDETGVALENTSTVVLDRSTLLYGGMMLINPWHAMPADYTNAEGELISIGNASSWKIAVDNGNVKIYPVAYDALSAMIDGAAAEGITDYIVREAYRTNEDQTAYFEKRMEKLSADYSGDILIEQTKKYVNYPGTSEYQTGMSFQIGAYNKENAELNKQGSGAAFQSLDQGKWMTENCWKYGIIFRFPTQDFPNASWEDKSYKTGVSSVMNLYRYVGKPHAVAMRIMDYCLEEYVEFLIDHPHICIYEDGALRYEIYRVTADSSQSFELPVPNPASDYIASFDNMGGIVLAYAYNQ